MHVHYARFQLSLCRGPRLLQVPCLIAPLAYSNSLEGDSTPWCVPALSPCFPVGWDRGTSGTGAKVDVSFDGLLCIPPFLRLLVIDGLAACLWVGPRHRWLRLLREELCLTLNMMFTITHVLKVPQADVYLLAISKTNSTCVCLLNPREEGELGTTLAADQRTSRQRAEGVRIDGPSTYNGVLQGSLCGYGAVMHNTDTTNQPNKQRHTNKRIEGREP